MRKGYMYILLCGNGKYYTRSTKYLKRRFINTRRDQEQISRKNINLSWTIISTPLDDRPTQLDDRSTRLDDRFVTAR